MQRKYQLSINFERRLLIVKLIKKVFNKIKKVFCNIFKIFPIKKNRIYFISNQGEKYSCNPRAIFEYMYENYKGKYEFVYIANNNEIQSLLPKDIKTAKFRSVRERYYYHTSKVIISNFRFSPEYSKRKGQYYIQTWHGSTIPYKMIEKDVEDCLTPKYVKMAKHDSKYIDMILMGSTACQEIFDRCFYCDHKTVVSGTPRTDMLINKNKEDIKKIKKRLNISLDDYVVLYAPTFRNNQNIKESFLDNEKIKNAFKKSTGKNITILYRFHPNIALEAQKYNFEDYVKNVTDYFDIQDLILIADTMITDFSSCAFDMMFSGKQTLIYTNNAKKYAEQERGLYISLDKLPFMVADTEDDLVENIYKLSEYANEYEKKSKEFIKSMGCKEDGKASKRVADYIVSQVRNLK